MKLEPAAAPRIDLGKLPYFNGFPYLATRLASAVYHIRLLPAEWSRDAQWDFALPQAGANGLPVCLVRDAERGEYFDPETGGTQIAGIPRAGILPPGEPTMGLPSRSSGVWDPAGRCRFHAPAQGQQGRQGVCVWRAA